MKKHIFTVFIFILLVAVLAGVMWLRADWGIPHASVGRAPDFCTHDSWTDGTCSRCGLDCPHRIWEEGHCVRCGYGCPHPDWGTGECVECALPCPHGEYLVETHSCRLCHKVLPHQYEGYRCRICSEKLAFEDRYLPWEIFAHSDRPGTVETLSYETPDYFALHSGRESSETWTKKFCVYLPWGYDAEKEYDVLVLLHGMDGTERYWLLGDNRYYDIYNEDEKLHTKDMLDNMIASGLCREMIVVTPTFYKNTGNMQDYARYADQVRFMNELRLHILPMVAENYATYAADSTEAAISAAREHFAFAGLSMGSIYGYNAILPECLDLFAWFGMFAGSECSELEVATALTSPENQAYPISFLYNAAGTNDSMGPPHLIQYQNLLKMCPDQLAEGENAAFTYIQGAWHEYRAWCTGLYNFLRIAFY